MLITRTEIAQCVGPVFRGKGVTRSEIFEEAERVGARADILTELHLLPDREYHYLRDLWPYLPHVPIPF